MVTPHWPGLLIPIGRDCAEAADALDGPASGRIEPRSGGVGLKNRPINGLLRPCEEAPRVIGPPDSAVSGVPKAPKTPMFPGLLAAKTCARSTLRAYESSPILLTTLPHSCLRKSPLLLTAAAAVGRTDGHRWAVIRPPT